MPLYEYQCEKCGDVFEVMQKFADAPLKEHQVCGGAVHRLLSAPALQFKGTGWYITDYAKGSKSSGRESDKSKKSDSSAESSGSANGGSAAKPASSTKTTDSK